MTIPDYQSLMLPVLRLLGDGELRRSRSVKDEMADAFALTSAERAQMLPSGRQRVIDNRVGWSLTYLSQAGLVRRPQRGIVAITDIGRDLLAEGLDRIDNTVLNRFESFRTFRDRTRVARPPVDGAADEVEAASPQDLIERAIVESRAALEEELLGRALSLSPTGFEDLVLALIEKMGYGEAGAVERTSATGDAGVDGIISQDPLGLDRIYMQAKRYAADRVIDRPRIHEFAGALLGKQGDRGVYITTSRFSSGARDEAERINARIELIDGERLAQLLVDYGVGVQPESTAILYRVDEDFFEGL